MLIPREMGRPAAAGPGGPERRVMDKTGLGRNEKPACLGADLCMQLVSVKYLLPKP